MTFRQRVFKALFGWPRLKPPTDHEARLIAALREQLADLPPVEPGRTVAEAAWANRRNELRHLLRHHDPRAFLESEWWALFSVIPQPQARKELRSASQDRRYWRRALEEPAWGRAPRQPRYYPASGYSVHKASMLYQLVTLGGPRVEDLEFILEFGASYGCLCRVCHQLGFRGTYVLFDFPEMKALQRFYLTGCGLGPDETNLVFASSLPEVSSALAAAVGKRGLFLSIYGVTDASLPIRHFFEKAASPLEHWFWAFQEVFRDINNAAYCRELQQRQPDRVWHMTAYPWSRNCALMYGRSQGERALIRNAEGHCLSDGAPSPALGPPAQRQVHADAPQSNFLSA